MAHSVTRTHRGLTVGDVVELSFPTGTAAVDVCNLGGSTLLVRLDADAFYAPDGTCCDGCYAVPAGRTRRFPLETTQPELRLLGDGEYSVEVPLGN